jgi:hypothetical protein
MPKVTARRQRSSTARRQQRTTLNRNTKPRVQFHYTTTCAAPRYYTETPKYYTKAAEYYTTNYASGSYYKGIPNY